MERNTDQTDARQEQVDNRMILLGFLVLVLMAAGALAIRNFFPDLNPYILAGLGAAVYLAYLGAALQAELAAKKAENDKAETATVTVPAEITSQERS